MKPVKIFLSVSVALTACLVAIHIANTYAPVAPHGKIPTTSYGAYLAAQHALYTNDFDTADEFLNQVSDDAKEYDSVAEIRLLTNFLHGTMPTDITKLAKQKSVISRIIMDAYLVQNNKWADVYAKHKNDNMRLLAPFRIWSGVANNYITKTFKFIDSLGTNPSWQAFLRGQVYAEQGRIQKAAAEFEKVKPEFMNINDYLYLMSFYKHNKLEDAAKKLFTEFTSKPGSMFMAGYTDTPDWSLFSGYKNQMAFNLVQTVAHTQSMSHSDLALLLLSFADNVADKNQIQSDAINYHAGLYMIANNGDYNKRFARVSESSPYYPFVKLRLAEVNRDEKAVRKAVAAQPLFMPAVNQLVGLQTQRGDKRGALKTINTSLENPAISLSAKAYLLKMRAETNFIFDDFTAAQQDVNSADALLGKPDPDVFSIQARIWAATGEKLDKAYVYGLRLVQFAPMDTCTWDTLGYVIWAREGVNEALDVIKRVAEMANSCSPLFEHLGDMYMEINDKKLARDAYLRAIELSGDGLSVKPALERKLKKVQ